MTKKRSCRGRYVLLFKAEDATLTLCSIFCEHGGVSSDHVVVVVDISGNGIKKNPFLSPLSRHQSQSLRLMRTWMGTRFEEFNNSSHCCWRAVQSKTAALDGTWRLLILHCYVVYPRRVLQVRMYEACGFRMDIRCGGEVENPNPVVYRLHVAT